jgi:hypothetical protein
MHEMVPLGRTDILLKFSGRLQPCRRVSRLRREGDGGRGRRKGTAEGGRRKWQSPWGLWWTIQGRRCRTPVPAAVGCAAALCLRERATGSHGHGGEGLRHTGTVLYRMIATGQARRRRRKAPPARKPSSTAASAAAEAGNALPRRTRRHRDPVNIGGPPR